MRINRDQRLRPKAPARVNRVDLLSDIRRPDLGKRAGKARVVRNERAIQIKYIHDDLSLLCLPYPPKDLDASSRQVVCFL